MGIDRAGAPFIGGAALVALIVAVSGHGLWASPFVVLTLFFLYFFRDPDRRVAAAPNEVVSPADGRVLVAGEAEPAGSPPGTWLQISIFLSPADVHVNRVPVAGLVTRVARTAGRFLPAYRAEAASQNERTEIWIDRGGQTIVVRQVVGMLARRIVCRVHEGDRVETGQRYGIMKFGSRMDIYLPPDATITTHVGDRVRGGETVLARLVSAREAQG